MSDATREAARQSALADLAILDTAPEREFDVLAETARRLLGTRMSSITLIDRERQWFKARCGPLAAETARGPALCTVVVETEAPLLLGDASVDARFAANPFVIGQPNIRFYAGVPIRAKVADGGFVAIGTLCALDDRPREVTVDDLRVLTDLACVAEALIEARSVARRAVVLAEDRRIDAERSERERRQLSRAESMAGMGSWRYDLAENRTAWSDGVFAIYEVPVLTGVPNGGILDFFPEPDRTILEDAAKCLIETGVPFELELSLVTAKGNERRVRCAGEIEGHAGIPMAIVGLVHDITKQRCMELALLRYAQTDDLTQLPNRAAFNRTLDDRLLEAHASGEAVAVLLMDLDGFKNVNDALGHASGDEVLRQVAERLRASYLSNCFAARLGGDEFAIVSLGASSRQEIEAQVERLLRDLHVVTEHSGKIARVTGTIGIAWSGRDADDRETLLRHADAALYAAKRSCKGTACTFLKVADHSQAA